MQRRVEAEEERWEKLKEHLKQLCVRRAAKSGTPYGCSLVAKGAAGLIGLGNCGVGVSFQPDNAPPRVFSQRS